MAIGLTTKYAVTHSNGSTSLSRLNGKSDMSPDEKHLAVISSAGEVCLTIYRIDNNAKTVSIVDTIKSNALTALSLQTLKGVKYSPDGKWLLVWTPNDAFGTQCYIYPVNSDGTLGSPQQIQGISQLPANTAQRILCDAQWSKDGKYILCSIYSSGNNPKAMRIFSFDSSRGIATEIHADTSAQVNNTGSMMYSIWTPKGDKCCAIYPLSAKYFKIDTSNNTVTTIPWNEMFDIEPAVLTDNTVVSVSNGFKHIQYYTAGTTVVNYVYDETQDKFIKQPEIHADIKQFLNANTFIGFDKTEKYMMAYNKNTYNSLSICKFTEDAKEWVIDERQLAIPNSAPFSLQSYNLNQALYCLQNVLVLVHSPLSGTSAPNETIQVWDMTGLAPMKMQITDDNGVIYHPETNSDIVLVSGTSASTILDKAVADVNKNVERTNSAIYKHSQPRIWIQDVQPPTWEHGDIWIQKP